MCRARFPLLSFVCAFFPGETGPPDSDIEGGADVPHDPVRGHDEGREGRNRRRRRGGEPDSPKTKVPVHLPTSCWYRLYVEARYSCLDSPGRETAGRLRTASVLVLEFGCFGWLIGFVGWLFGCRIFGLFRLPPVKRGWVKRSG